MNDLPNATEEQHVHSAMPGMPTLCYVSAFERFRSFAWCTHGVAFNEQGGARESTSTTPEVTGTRVEDTTYRRGYRGSLEGATGCRELGPDLPTAWYVNMPTVAEAPGCSWNTTENTVFAQ